MGLLRVVSSEGVVDDLDRRELCLRLSKTALDVLDVPDDRSRHLPQCGPSPQDSGADRENYFLDPGEIHEGPRSRKKTCNPYARTLTLAFAV